MKKTHPRSTVRTLRRALACAAAGWAFLGPAGAAAQAPEPDSLAIRARAQAAPLELLLANRDALGLTPGQVERLGAIRARLQAANDPLVQEMLGLRRSWQGERLLLRAQGRRGVAAGNPRLQGIRARAEPLLGRIQENNRMAMREVNRVLGPDQRMRLRALVEALRARERPGAPGGGEAAGPGPLGR